MLRIMMILGICFSVLVTGSDAQTGVLAGAVRDSSLQEPLVSANISLLGTKLGVSTSADGTFLLRGIPPGSHQLRVSLIGYSAIELSVTIAANESVHVDLYLQSEHVEEEEVVVTATRTVRHIADVPVRVEAIPQEEVEEKLLMNPSSVGMLLNESTGMRVQTTSAASSSANLRIQGLNGRYTQLLVDGIPAYGGLAAGFSLAQIPPLNLRQVEVIKGASSALYGADAIAGVVNFITKDPAPQPEFSALVNGTTQRGADIAAFYARQFSDVGFTVLGSRSAQARYDVDGDGFGDIAEYERFTLSPKLLLDPAENLRVRMAFGISLEDRLGGVMHAPRPSPGAETPYVEELHSRRLDFSSQFDWAVSESGAITAKVAWGTLRRNAFYGSAPFNATQEVLYADAQYARSYASHAILLGASVNSDVYSDRTPDVGSSRNYHSSVPAVFAQDEFAVSEYWTLLLSGRVDFHNFLGTFFTPRISAMVRPASMLTMRIGGGTGFKSPTMFVEEAEESGFQNLRPLGRPRAEKATSFSFDLNWRGILGQTGVSINAAAYVTDVAHALLADQDSLANDIVYLRSASGAMLVRGGELSAKCTFNEFKLSLGYTYVYASQNDNGETYELALNPRHSLGAVLVWESQRSGAKVGFENYWIGPQRLERNPFRDRSPHYWITGLIAEKGFGHLRLFVNLENIFDTRQTRYEPIVVGDVQTTVIRLLPIYAPLEGRVFNGGVRYVL